jgi:vancomycin resistance protein YoaR
MSSDAQSTPRLKIPKVPLPALIAVGVVAFVLAVYGINRMTAGDQVMGSVQLDGVELGGMTPEEAALAISDHEALLADEPASFLIRDSIVNIQPIATGFSFENRVILDRALAIGREGGFFGEFWWWLTHLFQTTNLDVAASTDPEALELILAQWDEEAVGNPPFPGAVVVNGTEPEPQYPAAGEMLDRGAVPGMMLASFSSIDREIVTLPIVRAEPELTAAQVDSAVSTARLILAGPVTLSNPEREKEVTFNKEELASALRSELSAGGIVFRMETDVVSGLLQPLKAELEDPPVNAELQIDGNAVTVIPGLRGTLVDDHIVAESLLTAAASASRRGVLPIEEAVDPDITTAELEALGITHKVSQFTTHHDCCQNRVTNIHLFADTIDGTIVMPGETFSLNLTVGERTAEAGYLEDGTIVAGEIVPTVGGGVSQFATTFYNAVFWGGYEDVTHKPHSFYISRYPLGIEATINWPVPDLHFRNNTDKAILIKTSYTSTSITVMFYSDNDGRIIAGQQAGGRLRMETVAEGGPNARVISATVSDRYGFREPPAPLYRPDPTIPPEVQEEIQGPSQGFSVTVTRTIAHLGQITTNEWTVIYSPRRQIFLVNPCTLEANCPTTTTTTIPEETTTTDTTTTTTP